MKITLNELKRIDPLKAQKIINALDRNRPGTREKLEKNGRIYKSNVLNSIIKLISHK
jgi:hypothetical protein